MKIKCDISLTLFGLALGGCNMTIPSKPYPPESGKADAYAGLSAQLSDWIRSGIRKQKITGLSIALIDGDQIVWAEGFGYADKANRQPATADTLYKAGSISKVFTATAIMQLVEQGKVDLDAPIQTYIPELKPKYHFKVGIPITLRHIMSHRSGLIGNRMAGMFTVQPEPYQTQLDYLNSVHQPYAPGSVTAYSNLATNLQGMVIERVTGEQFENYIKAHILTPLGMHNSGFDDRHIDPALLSKAYRQNKQAVELPLRDIPAGNLHSSVIELAGFARMVLANGGTILPQKSLQQMLIQQPLQGAAADRETDFGLNWVIERPAVKHLGKVAWHNGGTIHFMSSMAILPEQGLAVVVLSNSANAMEFVEQATDRILLDAAVIKSGIHKPSRPVPSPVVAFSPAIQKQLPGEYATIAGAVKFYPSGEGVKVKLMGLTLKLKQHENGWLSLHPRLFGFIPIPIKALQSLRIKVQQGDQQTLLLGNDKGTQFIAGVKVQPYTIPEAWSDYPGNYKVDLPDGDYPWFRDISLLEKDGYLYAATSVENQGAMMLIVRPISGQEGIIEGIGQGMQETIYLDQVDGRPVLHYSGYRFIKEG